MGEVAVALTGLLPAASDVPWPWPTLTPTPTLFHPTTAESQTKAAQLTEKLQQGQAVLAARRGELGEAQRQLAAWQAKVRGGGVGRDCHAWTEAATAPPARLVMA